MLYVSAPPTRNSSTIPTEWSLLSSITSWSTADRSAPPPGGALSRNPASTKMTRQTCHPVPYGGRPEPRRPLTLAAERRQTLTDAVLLIRNNRSTMDCNRVYVSTGMSGETVSESETCSTIFRLRRRTTQAT